MSLTRAPSDLKFLLNERAAIAGALESAERNRKVLEAGIRRDEARLAARRAQMGAMRQASLLHARELGAIDLVLGTTHPNVDANCVGSVNGWSTPIRRRGALKALVFRLLQAAAPDSVPTLALVGPAAAAFGWPLTTPEERDAAARIVRRVLQKARDAGLVMPVHGRARGVTGRWVWRSSTPSVSEFLSLRSHDADEDPIRGEVGGQRAGGSHG